MSRPMTERDVERIEKLVNAGVGLLQGASGSVASAAVGFLIGGPPGAAAGGAVAWAVSQGLGRLGREFGRRALGPREEARIGCVLGLSIAQIASRMDAGERVRTDGFFDHTESDRSGAEAVMENIILKSQREPEELKLPYMANLLANIAFDATVSPAMAHQVIKAAEELTYRQLCILRLAVTKDDFSLRESDYRGQQSFVKELYQVLYECLGLYSRGYINFGGEVLFGPTDVKPASITVQGLGTDMYNLMQLGVIPRADVAAIAEQLRSDT